MAKSRVIMEMSGEEAKLLASYQKAMRENQKFKDELKELSRAGKQSTDWTDKFGGSVKKAFDPKNVMAMAGALAGVGGVGAAITKVIGLAGEARDEIKGIAGELTASYDAAKNLWQISQGAKGYAGLRRDQRNAMAMEGLGREESQQLLFNLQSADQGKNLMAVAKAGRFMDPFVAAQYQSTMDSPLNYGSAGYSPEQNFSGLLAGAGRSKYNTAETADWMLRAAPDISGFDTSQAELLGVGGAMSYGTVSPEKLATLLLTGRAELNKWKQNAIASMEAATEAPEAPESPVYEEPKFRGTPTASSLQAYQYRIEDEKERYAEKKAEYDKELAKYEKDFAEWKKAETGRRVIGEKAAGAAGLIQTFEAMREYDPKAYQDLTINNKEFGSFATKFGEALPQAKEVIPGIQAEIDAGRAYQEKINEKRPRQLEEQHQQRVAAAMVSVALEDKADEENRLKTAISQTTALTALVGGSLTGVKAWEGMLESEATIAGVKNATEAAQRSMVQQIYRYAPEQFEKHLSGMGVEVQKKYISPGGSMGGRPVEVDEVSVSKVTDEVRRGITASIAELGGQRIESDYEADLGAAGSEGRITKVTPVDMSETNDELAGLGGKLDELIEVTRDGQRGSQGELATTPEPGGHGY